MQTEGALNRGVPKVLSTKDKGAIPYIFASLHASSTLRRFNVGRILGRLTTAYPTSDSEIEARYRKERSW